MGQQDHLLASLLQMGYPENICKVGLKICQNDLKATIDYINRKLSKPVPNGKPMDERTGGNLMKRGGRNRRGRGFEDDTDHEITQPRPKQLVVNLSDLMNNVYLNDGVKVAPPVKKKLAFKTPILAESFDGSLQPATLLGLDQKSSRNGEHVVQIIYDAVCMQEVVPLALIRNVHGQKIELEELPIYRDPNEDRVSFNRNPTTYQQNESNTFESYDRQPQRGGRGGRGRGGNSRGRFNRGRRGRFTRHQ